VSTISIFGQAFNFSGKFRFLARFTVEDLEFWRNFSQRFKFLTKFSIFDDKFRFVGINLIFLWKNDPPKNRQRFCLKFAILAQISIFDENFNYFESI